MTGTTRPCGMAQAEERPDQPEVRAEQGENEDVPDHDLPPLTTRKELTRARARGKASALRYQT